MKHFISLATLIITAAAPVVFAASSFDTSHLPYTDVRTSHVAAVAISLLTKEGVIQGNPDGTFKPSALLNRAEFIKIVMGLTPGDSGPPSQPCFPDVPVDAWFADSVCRAKQEGIVQGNAREGVPPEQWLFEPARPVQYEEAVKILIGAYNLPVTPQEGEEWYVPYLRTADAQQLTLATIAAGDTLKRADMARLTARFLTHSEDSLDAFLASEAGVSTPDDVIENTETDGETEVQRVTTTMPPYERRPQFIELGIESPILASVIGGGAIEIVPEDKLVSIASINVYNGQGDFLGQAFREQASGHYFLHANKILSVPWSNTSIINIRGVSSAGGSISKYGEKVQIYRIYLWQGNSVVYDEGPFPAFQTAHVIPTSISNVGPETQELAPEHRAFLASFRFQGTGDLRLKNIMFSVEGENAPMPSDIWLSADGMEEAFQCQPEIARIACFDIPELMGTLKNGQRTLTLRGSIPFVSGNATMQLGIKEPGAPGTTGAIRWTDGVTDYDWVPFVAPVVKGTLFSK